MLLFCLASICLALPARAAEHAATYGPVQPNETLYRIALRHRPQGSTVAQTMMSIFEKNPQAFAGGNINRLRVGAILRLPTSEEIDRIGRRQAHGQASAQIDRFEEEAREQKAARGEAMPLGQLPRDPELATGLEFAAEVSEPDARQVGEIRQALAAEQQAGGKIVLPEPKPPKRKRRQKSEAPLFRYSYDLSIADDDNVRLAQNDEDIRADLIFSPMLKATAGKSLDDFTLLNYGGRVTYNYFETFDELNNFDFEVNLRYRFALASGFSSPIYALSAKLGGLEYESEMRDSTLLTLAAEFSKWLSDSLNMTAGLSLRRRESVSEVFDTSETRVFVNLDIDLSKKDLVYTTLSYIEGDTVSSATPSLGIINAADAIEPDDAFGGVDLNQFAYRLEAETLVLTLGYNRILKDGLSLDLSARWVDSEAVEDDAIGYERTIVRASLLGRF